MNIKLLNVEMDSNRLPVIVAEKEFDFYKENVNETSEIVEMINEYFRLDRKTEEYVYMVSLDTAGHILAVFEVSHGGVDRSYSGTREIFQKALLSGAVGIVVLHNHPSGCCDNPSDLDVLICERIRKAGELIGVELYDFVIIGSEGTYYSFSDIYKKTLAS